MKLSRRKRRYLNRQVKRQKNFPVQADDFDQVFTPDHLYEACKKTRRKVSWKPETQKYVLLSAANLHKLHRTMINGKFHSAGFREFDLVERGKLRHIKAVCFEERIAQRCLCDYSLAPILLRGLIYDNGACIEKKGYTFAQKRCKRHLAEYVRKHGTEGYVLTFDFKSFFENIPHEGIENLIRKNFSDPKIIDLLLYLVKLNGSKGLGLGSQISQILAQVYPSKLDHYIKEQLKIKYYARYNDDGYLIHPSKEYLKTCLKKIKKICDELGIILHPTKVRLTKLSKGFVFLKARYFVTSTGKIIRKPARESVIKQRRKMKKMAQLVLAGKISQEDFETSYQSHRAYMDGFDAYKTRCSEDTLFRKLLHEISMQT